MSVWQIKNKVSIMFDVITNIANLIHFKTPLKYLIIGKISPIISEALKYHKESRNTMYKLLNYQREEKHTDLYSEKLAKSMHLAFQKDDKPFEALNQNFGILFAKAYEAENEVLHPKQLVNSWLLKTKDDAFAVVAVRVNPDGSPDEISNGSILVFESQNLLEYTELPMLKLSDQTIVDVTANYDASIDQYLI